MHKFIYFFISQLVFVTYVSAAEPILAILHNVNTNETQEFNIGNYNFYCQPYGVISLEKLFRDSEQNSLCQQSIHTFYQKNPDLKYLALSSLYLQQRYHVSFKESMCVLYAKGELSWSEILLKKGLAILKPKFDDEEFVYSYTQAEIEAKLSKSGLWDTDIHKNCIPE